MAPKLILAQAPKAKAKAKAEAAEVAVQQGVPNAAGYIAGMCFPASISEGYFPEPVYGLASRKKVFHRTLECAKACNPKKQEYILEFDKSLALYQGRRACKKC